MNKIRNYVGKGLSGILLGAALCVGAAFPALAAGTVNSVSISFTDRYEIGEIKEPEITCRTRGISLDSVSWSKDPEDWTPGKKITATLVLSSEDGEFLSTYGSKSCRISGADFSSAQGKDGVLTVKVGYYPVVQLDVPETAGWSALNKNKAVWEKVPYATGYQLRLYREDRRLRTIDVTGTSKDLSEYMTKEGYYYYEIRAVGKSKSDAKYRVASEYVSSSDQVLDDLGDTEGRWKNYNEGRKYLGEDGSYVVNKWYKIQDKWYYFNADGYMMTGWQRIDGLWYYLGTGGTMMTGWQKIDDIWYYLNDDGSMAVGWKMTAPGQWYYFYENGTMAADTVIDGCRLNSSGLYSN